MKIDLNQKLAVVTGGSGQLGRVICRTLAACGADVVIHYHQNEQKALELAAELEQTGVRTLAVQADVTDQDSVRKMKDKIVSKMGAPGIIVNNAVIQYRWKPVLEQGLEDYESQFQSCVIHNVLMTQAFVPAMREKRWGRVIAINTECAMQNAPTQSAYVSGKRGMDGVLRVLAREVGPDQVTVNQVAPGWIITENMPGTGEAHERYAADVPMKRRGCDQDIAPLVAFLASDLAGFITGQYISVSGGHVMPAI